MQAVNMQRNGFIELLRFFATLCIAMYHFEGLYTGQSIYFFSFYIFVEFFFILSGFFMYSNVEKTVGAFGYTLRMFLKMWPTYVFSFFFCLFARFFYDGLSLRELFQMGFNAKWQIFFLHSSGLAGDYALVNGVAGVYESALLLSGFFVFWALQKHLKTTLLFSPIFSMLIYSFILNRYGSLSQWGDNLGFITIGMLRGMAGILFGVFVRNLMLPWLRRYSSLVHWCLLTFSLLTFPVLVLLQKHISQWDMFGFVPVFGVMLCCVCLLDEKIKSIKIKSLFIRLGSFSYEIYTLHFALCLLIKHFFPGLPFAMMLFIYIFLTILTSVFIHRTSVPVQKFLIKIIYRTNTKITTQQ